MLILKRLFLGKIGRGDQRWMDKEDPRLFSKWRIGKLATPKAIVRSAIFSKLTSMLTGNEACSLLSSFAIFQALTMDGENCKSFLAILKSTSPRHFIRNHILISCSSNEVLQLCTPSEWLFFFFLDSSSPEACMHICELRVIAFRFCATPRLSKPMLNKLPLLYSTRYIESIPLFSSPAPSSINSSDPYHIPQCAIIPSLSFPSVQDSAKHNSRPLPLPATTHRTQSLSPSRPQKSP